MAKRKRIRWSANPTEFRAAVLSILSTAKTMTTKEIGTALIADYPHVVSQLCESWQPNLATIIRRHLRDLETIGPHKQGLPLQWKSPKETTAPPRPAKDLAASVLVDLTSRSQPPTVSPSPTPPTPTFAFSSDPMVSAYFSILLRQIAALDQRVRQLEAKPAALDQRVRRLETKLTAVGVHLSK